MEFNATFIISAVSFLIFAVLMNWILYEPIRKIVEKREKFLDENYEVAKNSDEKSKAILADKEEKFNKAKNEAKDFMNSKVEGAKNKQVDLKNEAQKKSADLVSLKKQEINEANSQTKASLESEVENIAEQIKSKILGRQG